MGRLPPLRDVFVQCHRHKPNIPILSFPVGVFVPGIERGVESVTIATRRKFDNLKPKYDRFPRLRTRTISGKTKRKSLEIVSAVNVIVLYKNNEKIFLKEVLFNTIRI